MSTAFETAKKALTDLIGRHKTDESGLVRDFETRLDELHARQREERAKAAEAARVANPDDQERARQAQIAYEGQIRRNRRAAALLHIVDEWCESNPDALTDPELLKAGSAFLGGGFVNGIPVPCDGLTVLLSSGETGA